MQFWWINRKGPFGRPRLRCGDIKRMDFREVECEGGIWM
jgi:hypothetical protein